MYLTIYKQSTTDLVSSFIYHPETKSVTDMRFTMYLWHVCQWSRARVNKKPHIPIQCNVIPALHLGTKNISQYLKIISKMELKCSNRRIMTFMYSKQESSMYYQNLYDEFFRQNTYIQILYTKQLYQTEIDRIKYI